YLMLAAHRLHMPQPYALLNPGTGRETLLLDTAAIANESGSLNPKLLPSLKEAWPTASPLRQLNWLWQIARLWSDFGEQQVASSLLSNHQLRVHGSLVRLLELVIDVQSPTLRQLGTFWQNLVPTAQPSIRDFLETLCHQLNQGDIATTQVLIHCLDQAIATTANGYHTDYGLAVMTDQGPSRKRNEDACYPTSGTVQTHTLGPQAKPMERRPLLLLVCDGIGGHDGGDVASQLAIATIEQQLSPLLKQLAHQPQHDPATVAMALEQAICTANDNISHYNDQGRRQARDRMGTTLVMALVIGVHIYIAHVGDSRAYRISINSCQQITFDDDVAAREVRLGYGFYADVVNRPGTGALIQALGMGHSTALHVIVQRLILDDDIVLLLCSDGLSDYDRIEQYWPTHILPLLKGHKHKPVAAVTSLVQLANTYNGHDNVTVGVITGYLQTLKPPIVPAPTSDQVTSISTPSTPSSNPPVPLSSLSTLIPSEVVSIPQKPKKTGSIWPILFGLLGILGTVAAITIVFFRNAPIAFWPRSNPTPPEAIQDKIDQDIEIVGISDDELPSPLLTPRSYLQLSQPIDLLEGPQSTENSSNSLGQLPSGTIVQVLTRQEPAAEQSRWVKLQVCAVSSPGQPRRNNPTNLTDTEASSVASAPTIDDSAVTTNELNPLNSGAMGWVLEAQLAEVALTAEVLNCPPE
ncbi:MAG: protein phosphatase 2C domain-containing protein, partial [Leptolyngbyaceae cyanobacterium MAG.088]|nr:protein phosphatase 2C domain-containing protein [Leptolyngbyaceae cyanobacterium MAG.088]